VTKGYDSFDLPRPQARERRHGCLFYGCITAVVLLVLGAVAAFLAVRYVVNRIVQEVVKYSDTSPVPLPRVEMPLEQRRRLRERIDDFKKALDEGRPTAPLALNADEINALIAEDPNLNGRLYVTLEGDKIRGRVSFPLGDLGLPALAGRYLNGAATLKASLENGVLIVTIDSLEVKGRPVPEQAMEGLRKENLAKDAYRDPKNAEFLRKLERIEIKDGQVIIEPRTPRGESKAGDAGGGAATKGDVTPEGGSEGAATKPGEPKGGDAAPAAPAPKEGSNPEGQPRGTTQR
jgi:hypothetical protein